MLRARQILEVALTEIAHTHPAGKLILHQGGGRQ
jgi:hypothetical protein